MLHTHNMLLHEPKLICLYPKPLYLCLIAINEPIKFTLQSIKCIYSKHSLYLRKSNIYLPVQMYPHYLVNLFILIISITVFFIPQRFHQPFLLIQSYGIR